MSAVHASPCVETTPGSRQLILCLVRFVKIALILAVAVLTCAAVAQPPPAGPAPTPKSYRVNFVVSAESGQAIAVVENRAYSTVEAFKEWISTLPPGTWVSVRLTDQAFPNGNAFVGSLGQLRSFCEERHIQLTSKPPSFK